MEQSRPLTETHKLFSTDAPRRDWAHFPSDGFSAPACGVVYRLSDTVPNGLSLGGVDTGCIDLETSGLLGYTTIFNTHCPRRGPVNLPILGVNVGGETWVLCDPTQMKQGDGEYQLKMLKAGVIGPSRETLRFDGVRTVKEIHYWGHYPVADLEFETDAPVEVGLRAWSPFLPGCVVDSMLPGSVFEVHLRNSTNTRQSGTVAFSFPGPEPNEAGATRFERRAVSGLFTGVEVKAPLASYVLGALGTASIRLGGELGAEGAGWARIASDLPVPEPAQPGASCAVDFTLEPSAELVVRFLLTWHAPTWKGGGYNWSERGGTYTHMYAKHYRSAADAADKLAEHHTTLLRRTLAWQQVVYTENRLPVWLRDSLINVLYMIAEDGMWAQAGPALPDWIKEEDGLFGMNECPRVCPQIENIPCSFYGSLPFVYFFPELALSTIRGYQGYQYPDGAPAWIFGGMTCESPVIDFASPARGYQYATNGISLAAVVDRFLLCCDTPDQEYLKEFYPMVKRCMEWTARLRTTPSYSEGERIVSMPSMDSDEFLKPPREWLEAAEPGWFGLTAHIGGLHLAQARITERMARDVGDIAFAKQCGEWVRAGVEAMDRRLWTGSYYLNCFDPETGETSDFVFAYQLDGEWITEHHGLPSALPPGRVGACLETIKRCNVALTKYGAVNYAHTDGTPIRQAKEGTWDYGAYSYFPPEALMLAMNFMYAGQKVFGQELARRVWHNLICLQGYTWDMPNIMRGDADTGERSSGNDYYQDMILWSLPAALEGADLSTPTRPGGFARRICAAARGE